MKLEYKIFLFLISFLLFIPIQAQNKVIYATRVHSSPALDGKLDDSLWQLARPIDDFLQQEPIPGSTPSFQTSVRIIYNEHAIYVGVMCYDSEPSRIIARELKKDGNLRGDDNFQIIFDTFNDKKSAYWFGTNPLSMRDDALLSGMDFRGFNENWDGIWQVKSAIVDSGWSIEFEFPFSTFKFHKAEEQIWGINFARQIRRLNEQVLWSSVGANLGLFKLAYAGKLIGIQKIERGDPVYIKPFISAGFQNSTDFQKKILKTGIDIKYGITQNLTFDITLNTDFAQVESDRAKINLTRFPLFLPEKRDFFLENSSIFDYTFGFRNYIFYSRRIGLSDGNEIPIIGGARIVGRINKSEIGIVSVQTSSKETEPSTNYSVARFKYDLFEQSYIGVILTNKISSKGFNRVYGTDINLNFTDFLGDQTLTIGGGALRSDETGGGKNNNAYKFFISFPNDLMNSFVSYREAQADFNPAMGFLFRNNFKSLTSHLKLSPRVNYFGIKKLNFTLFESDLYWDDKTNLSSSYFSFSPFGFITNADDMFEIEFENNFDSFDSDFYILDTITIKAGEYRFKSIGFDLHTSRSRNIFGSLSFTKGSYYSGYKDGLSAEINLMFSSNFSISSNFEINRIRINERIFLTEEIGFKLHYDFSTMTYSSIYTQWNNELNEININYRFSWQPKIGSNFYFVVNHILSSKEKIKTKDIVILSKFVWLLII